MGLDTVPRLLGEHWLTYRKNWRPQVKQITKWYEAGMDRACKATLWIAFHLPEIALGVILAAFALTGCA